MGLIILRTLLILLCLGAAFALKAPRFRSRLPFASTPKNLRKEVVGQCEEKWRKATLDHFTWVCVQHTCSFYHAEALSLFRTLALALALHMVYVDDNCMHETIPDFMSQVKPDQGMEKFDQRYFLCSSHWKPDNEGRPGPIFFYLGNEADVTLCV